MVQWQVESKLEGLACETKSKQWYYIIDIRGPSSIQPMGYGGCWCCGGKMVHFNDVLGVTASILVSSGGNLPDYFKGPQVNWKSAPQLKCILAQFILWRGWYTSVHLCSSDYILYTDTSWCHSRVKVVLTCLLTLTPNKDIVQKILFR